MLAVFVPSLIRVACDTTSARIGLATSRGDGHVVAAVTRAFAGLPEKSGGKRGETKIDRCGCPAKQRARKGQSP